MDYDYIKNLWEKALIDLLNLKLDGEVINVLTLQTIDSVKRIEIYELYESRAKKADESNLSYFHSSNPFTLAQRTSLSLKNRLWYIYLATYFGKSNKSGWTLFMRTSFRHDSTLIGLEEIIDSRDSYYSYLDSIDLFKDTSYSNHRKYTKKSLHGRKGLICSMDYFLDNIDIFCHEDFQDFDTIYRNALNIPNFGRMAAFDFTSSLSKCKLNVNEPTQMYHEQSTGPLQALEEILVLANCKDISKTTKVDFGNRLLSWFVENSEIFFIAQVLEDAICNWQKSSKKYIRYFG